jgi:hypothetical protein
MNNLLSVIYSIGYSIKFIFKAGVANSIMNAQRTTDYGSAV